MNNNTFFVDTVCWIALLNQQDNLHTKTNRLYKKLLKSGSHVITTSSILVETANALCDPAYKSAVITFRNNLLASTRVEIIFVDRELWEKGWMLYEQRSDKAWSLTDCISIVVMKEWNIHKVLTSDHHFVQAGFEALLINK
ncbi:MAG TPA: PIN domain-containing protein [Methanospirillum sp.]|jgi:hypothetical protein|uniref:type II toxin-antitoxin system VapC family toxin n=1 Tax=Methanospirillum sp. TaxID=45200 RepID=UPI002C06CC96|nr:PIN domain-containing protein [Methanospirillum sp.]MDD5049610.1 PIN domain-containing protein [Methanoregulaceae archaeon]HPY61418.1 PIN domain-containing protein [Methanospirillum sp.]HQB99893.1 PIN domain-containing protein [Methanospirillum sp.]